MPTLYGQKYSQDQLRRRSGKMAQLAGITRYRLQEGTERDVEICDVRTGSGFRFHICPSRGMDITFAEHNGRPLCWNSATGVVHPAFYEAQNLGWLRGFPGGLLTTCGFSNFSAPSADGNEYYGLHDRASYLPATQVRTFEEWNGDNYELIVEGTLRQTRVFGENLTLTRRISTTLGAESLHVEDRLKNEGFESVPAVILYHCNFGFPVVSEDSEIRMPSTLAEPTCEFGEQTLASWSRFGAPQAGIAERCYFHTMQPDSSGIVRAEIWNEKLGFGAFMRYRFDQLPYFTQWKMMGAGTYVNGLEPSNAPLEPRDRLREKNQLPFLEPGKTKVFEIELGTST